MPLREGLQDLYNKEWQWQEDGMTVTRTCQWSAPGCHDGCGVLFYTKDNRLVKVEGDPNNPYNKGRLCMRCLDLIEAVEHPDRVLYPLRRKGERGSNQWERISWDEALHTIKEKWEDIIERYGREAVAVVSGTGRNIWPTRTIASTIFNTPTASSGFLSGESCYTPRMMAMNAVFGNPSVIDCAQMYEESFDNPQWQAPKVVINWGCDPLRSNADGFYGHWIIDLMKQGTQFITVDPNLHWLGSRSKYLLQLRPGTDAALALAMINVIIAEELYDKEFVASHCFGFNQLAKRVAEWTPERVAEISWVPSERIYQAARFFAEAGTGSVHWGLAVDTQKNGIPAAHAICCLWAICGYVDKPGTNILINIGHSSREHQAFFNARAPEDARIGNAGSGKILGYDLYPMRQFQGMGANSDLVLECLESATPHPVKMMMAIGTNTIANMSAQAKRVFNAMSTIEFFVSAEVFITPTVAAFADIVLPLAMSCERDSMRSWWAPLRTISKVITTGEAVGDEELLLRMGKVFHPKQFPWSNLREVYNEILQSRPGTNAYRGTFEELEKQVFTYEKFTYDKAQNAMLRADGQPGYNTSTGKIELYVSLFEACGLDPLPDYHEPTESPVSTPELTEMFPFVLTSGRRSFEFFHSEHRQLPTMREFHPWPLVEINTTDAAEYGIVDGDWVWLENIHGKAKFKALLTQGMLRGVLSAEHGWWFPEKDGAIPSYFGLFESNVNLLTTMCDIGPSGFGGPYKTQICKLYKVTANNDTLERMPEQIKREVEAYCYISTPPDKRQRA